MAATRAGRAARVQPAHRLTDQPCFALYSTINAVTRAYRPLLDPLGLTYTQYIVMLALWEHDGVDLKSLGERTLLDPPTLTPVVKRLAAKGLLTRVRATTDERRLVLTVTEAGRQLQRDAREVPRQMVCQVGLEPAQERTLLELCERMRESLASPAQ
jgi:MarR family transcriptional regulator, organic hydroperoxide resistance regulator